MPTRVIHVRRPQDVPAAAKAAADVLRAGGLLGFPTETVYGVGAMTTLPDALERLRDLKDRPSRPFGVHMGTPADAGLYARDLPPAAANIIRKGWPGPITLLLKAGGRLADDELQRRGLYDVLCQDDVIGLRCPDSAVTGAALRGAGGPVVASSANLAGRPSPRSADDVLEQLDGRIDLLLNSGPTRYGKDSTIVDFSGGPWKVLRQGVHDERMIRALATRRVLFVCTGNTCRSPMAAGLFAATLARRFSCKPSDLERHGIEVLSAGLLAVDGGRAAAEAAGAARELGADIAHHRTRKLTANMIEESDAVFCMTGRHVQEVRRLAPSQAAKVRRLDESADIEDPIGMGEGEYLRTARRIAESLESVLDEFAPGRPEGPAGGRVP